MKKSLAVLFSVAVLLVALVVLSGCSPKAQPAQPQQSAQPATPAAPAPQVATQTAAQPAQPAAQTATQPAPATAPSASKHAAPATMQNGFDKYIAGLPGMFNAANASGVTCTYQFDVTGSDDPGMYWVTINGGQCTVGDGTAANPTLTITTPEKLWFGIVNGSVNGTSAFMTGQYKAAPMNNIKYLQNMKKYFSSAI